ncbi:MAG: cation transporter [Calditrichaceae bacterium]|nr:cation transporter [Calditrichaceae bacterium]MBN2709477.1 cation transporter [Calditrichaceae bacterium]RQV94802.1 MAG: cation transporter [Calditrichota bacterium]
MHSHNHTEHQHHHYHVAPWRLLVTIVLNFIITIAQIIGGILSGSLSLISDALHNFSDGIAIIISYIAIRLNKKPKNFKYTFGYKRAEILAAVFNAAVLIGIGFYLLIEAYERFRNPVVIEGKLMTTVAIIGLLANFLGIILLKPGTSNNMNIRSAYLHLMSDTFSSVGVVLGGLAIYFFNIYWIDPVLTLIISIYIIKESYSIIKESIDLLMMAAPSNISIPEIEEKLSRINNINNLHHVHLWRINDTDIHFEAHVETDDIPISKTDDILRQIEQVLKENFGIYHVTIQFECQKCGIKKLV